MLADVRSALSLNSASNARLPLEGLIRVRRRFGVAWASCSRARLASSGEITTILLLLGPLCAIAGLSVDGFTTAVRRRVPRCEGLGPSNRSASGGRTEFIGISA